MRVNAYKTLIICYVTTATVLFGFGFSDNLAIEQNIENIAALDWKFDRVPRLKLTTTDNKNGLLRTEVLDSTISQELFSQTRKPFVAPVQPVTLVEPPQALPPPPEIVTPEPQPAPVAAMVSDPARFKLLGTANISNRWRALVLVTEQPEANWTEVGNKVLDWTITAISPHEILLENAGQNFVLKQYVENK